MAKTLIEKPLRRTLPATLLALPLLSLALGLPLAGGAAMGTLSDVLAAEGSPLALPARVVEDLHARGLAGDESLALAKSLVAPGLGLESRLALLDRLSTSLAADLAQEERRLTPHERAEILDVLGHEIRTAAGRAADIQCIYGCTDAFVRCVGECLRRCGLDISCVLDCLLACLKDYVQCLAQCPTRPEGLPGHVAQTRHAYQPPALADLLAGGIA